MEKIGKKKMKKEPMKKVHSDAIKHLKEDIKGYKEEIKHLKKEIKEDRELMKKMKIKK